MRVPNLFKQLRSRQSRERNRRAANRFTPTADGLEPRELLSITLSCVANISTKIPTLIEGKDYGNFISVSSSTIDGMDVAFSGEGNNGLQGIYLASNGSAPRTVVDTDTIVPNVQGSGFRMFGEPSLSHDVVAFIGYSKITNGTATTGIYYVDMVSPGVVHTVADTTMTAPNTIDGFGMFQVAPSISGNTIAFEADRYSLTSRHYYAGIYLYDGHDLHTIADENTFSPITSLTHKFAVSGSPIVDADGDVAFWGCYYDLEWSSYDGYVPSSTYNQGIYVYSHSTGQVTPAVSTSTSIPGWDGHHFEYFQNLNFADGVIAFNAGLGYTEPANGIYSNASGTWQHVVGALMSDVSGTMFTGIGPSSIDHGNMVFVGVTGGYSTNYGIYAKVSDSAPVKILQKNDSLDNQTVWSVYIGNHSLSGQAVVMNVQFGDSALLAIYEAVDTEMGNHSPVATKDTDYFISRNTTLNIPTNRGVLLNDKDPDGDPLTAVLVTQAAHGSVTLNTDGSFSYTPNVNYFGVDSFTYQASDGSLKSEVTTVEIGVHRANLAPITTDDTYTVSQNDTLTVSADNGVLLNDHDPDGDQLIAAIVAQPKTGQGTVTMRDDGSFVYTPGNYSGVVTFKYKASDGKAKSTLATVSITVVAALPSPISEAALSEKVLKAVYPVYWHYLDSGSVNKTADQRHAGIDFAAPFGTHVYAAKGGKVINAGGIYGTVAIFDGTNTVLYLHMTNIPDTIIGTEVSAGTYIGDVSNVSPDRINPHLHIEVRPNRRPIAFGFKRGANTADFTIDPLSYLG